MKLKNIFKKSHKDKFKPPNNRDREKIKPRSKFFRSEDSEPIPSKAVASNKKQRLAPAPATVLSPDVDRKKYSKGGEVKEAPILGATKGKPKKELSERELKELEARKLLKKLGRIENKSKNITKPNMKGIPTPLLIAGGIGVLGLTAYMIHKNRKKKL